MTLFNQRQARLLVPGFHPDPSVCSDRPGHLVLAFSSFEYFPGLPVWESNDAGKTWSFCSFAASREDQFTTSPLGDSMGFYASTIRWHNGTWYLIVTDVNRGAMIFTTTNLHGNWSGPKLIDGWPGIDPSLLFDDDGTCYICGNEAGSGEKPGIYAAPINPDTAQLLGPRHFLIGGITGSNPEGPHMYRHGDTYYLMWAEGGTEAGHMECMARATSVFGPYEVNPHNPLITNRSTHLMPQCIGHADLAPLGSSNHVDAADHDDDFFLVFLGLRTNADYPQQGWLGRENFGAHVRWPRNGWPELADQSFFISPDDPGSARPLTDSTAAWICPGVDREHLFTVTSADKSAAKSAEKSSVKSAEKSAQNVVNVTATAVPIRENNAERFSAMITPGPRLIGRRQRSFTDTLTVRCDALAHNGYTGAIAFATSRVWATAFVDTRGERPSVRCRFYDKGVMASLADIPLRTGTEHVTIRIVGSDESYDFVAFIDGVTGNVTSAATNDTSSDTADDIFLGHVPCEPFASTHAGGFTGMLYGVYAHGEGSARFTCQ